jgi:membrane protease YdiL (CAAX protease family)
MTDVALGAAPGPGGLRARLRRSRGLILVELALVAAIFLADRPGLHLIVFSKTLYLLALACASLLIRGLWWGATGLRLDRNLPAWVLIGVIGGALIEAQKLYLTQPLLVQLIGPPNLSDLHGLIGDTALLPVGFALIWTLGAFGQEWVYRGWLTNRLADLFGRSRLGWVLAVVAANVLFGLAYGDQDPTGVIEAAVDGLLFALLYFATGRNLIAPMIAHGIQNSTDLVLIFANHYPISL